MSSLLELTVDLVAVHVLQTPMSTAELVAEINDVHQTLRSLDLNLSTDSRSISVPDNPAASIGKHSVTCLVCGGKFQSLGRHIRAVHNLTQRDYCEGFGLPFGTKLASQAFLAKRRMVAQENDLVGRMLQARRKGRK